MAQYIGIICSVYSINLFSWMKGLSYEMKANKLFFEPFYYTKNTIFIILFKIWHTLVHIHLQRGYHIHRMNKYPISKCQNPNHNTNWHNLHSNQQTLGLTWLLESTNNVDTLTWFWECKFQSLMIFCCLNEFIFELPLTAAPYFLQIDDKMFNRTTFFL